jgi:hypothetical protein
MGDGIPGNEGWTGLAFGRFFAGRGLATRLGLYQHLPRRPLRRVPGVGSQPVPVALVGERSIVS